MFVTEIRVGGAKARVLCVCVSVRERERGDASRGCLIGKQMNNVSLGWRRKGDHNQYCVYRRDRESNFSGMSHM